LRPKAALGIIGRYTLRIGLDQFPRRLGGELLGPASPARELEEKKKKSFGNYFT
jgi:hypothetical protein